jgi:hypothetical protein
MSFALADRRRRPKLRGLRGSVTRLLFSAKVFEHASEGGPERVACAKFPSPPYFSDGLQLRRRAERLEATFLIQRLAPLLCENSGKESRNNSGYCTPA